MSIDFGAVYVERKDLSKLSPTVIFQTQNRNHGVIGRTAYVLPILQEATVESAPAAFTSDGCSLAHTSSARNSRPFIDATLKFPTDGPRNI